MILATVLVAASALVMLFVGASHVHGTFFGSDLTPGDPELQKRMRNAPLAISSETRMWRAWIGFNAGFGMGYAFFGLVFGFLAIFHGELLFGSPFLILVGLLMVGGLALICRLYLFSIPFLITGAALILYVVGVIISLTR